MYKLKNNKGKCLFLWSLIIMGCFTAGYYDQVKDYLHRHLHDFVHYYRRGDLLDLPLYNGCDKVNKNGTRKLIGYDQGYQCIKPTNNLGKKPKINTKYKRREFTGQDTWHGPIEDICSKTKVNLFIIINLKGLNICLKHQCAMTITSELMLGNYNKQIYQKCKYYHCVIEIKNVFKENPFICNICFKLIQNKNKINPQIYII